MCHALTHGTHGASTGSDHRLRWDDVQLTCYHDIHRCAATLLPVAIVGSSRCGAPMWRTLHHERLSSSTPYWLATSVLSCRLTGFLCACTWYPVEQKRARRGLGTFWVEARTGEREEDVMTVQRGFLPILLLVLAVVVSLMGCERGPQGEQGAMTPRGRHRRHPGGL